MCTTVRRAKWDKKVSENFYPELGFSNLEMNISDTRLLYCMV